MTSRHDLLAWVNDTLGLSYSKVEQFASGAAACQICDVIWPGAVQMKKVKFDAKHEHEYIANYKVLQQVFTKKGVEKVIPVDRLIKAKFQENLMFAQWLKTFFDQRYSGNDYDPKERRQCASSSAGSAPTGAPRRATTSNTKTPTRSAPTKSAPTRSATARTTAARGPSTSAARSVRPAKPAVNDEQMDMLVQELAEVKVTTEGLEKERDFYFEKLRQIEVMCDEATIDSAVDLREKIKDILYAVEPGFEAPDEGAAVNGGEQAPDDEEF